MWRHKFTGAELLKRDPVLAGREKEHAAFPFFSANPVCTRKRLSLLGHYLPLRTSAAEINNTKQGGIKYQKEEKKKKTNFYSSRRRA